MKKQKDPDKKKYKHSFAGRLTWRVVLSLLLTMGLAAALIAFVAWLGMSTVMFTYFAKVNRDMRQGIDHVMTDVYLGTVNNVSNIENQLARPDSMPAIVERIVRLNPRVLGCGISFVEDYYPAKGRWYGPYARRNRDSTIVTEIVGDAQNDYFSNERYREAIASEEGFWSKPYFDCVDTLMPVVSYMLPIRDRSGRKVGVLCTDLSLEWLSGEVDEVITLMDDDKGEDDPDFRAYGFILDGDGRYVAHPDKQRILSKTYNDYCSVTPDTLDDHAGHMMLAGNEGSYSGGGQGDLKIDGSEVFLFYGPIECLGWSLGIVVSELLLYILGYILAVVLVVLIVIALLVVVVVNRHLIKGAVRPLKVLAATADKVAEGKFDTPLPEMKSRDEVHMLRDSFERMQQSLTRYVEQLKQTTAQQAAMESELTIAHNIQMAMLPKTFPPYPERTDIDVYGSLTPAKGVGGDLFDFRLRDGKLYFCIGDVSGKGVPASLVMTVAVTLFRTALATETEPDAIVRTINGVQSTDNDASMFVTLFVGVLDLATGCLRYCNAGHDAPLLIGSEVSVLPCDPNLPVGVMADWQFTVQQAELPHGTTIFLFTDGLNEAEDGFRQQFGDDRIMTVARKLSAGAVTAPRAVIDRMAAAVHSFVGTAEQSDDLTMLAIRFA